MEFKVGDKVVYPNHGVGVIEQVAKKSIGGTISSYYRLRLLSTDSMVMVPVDNTTTVGLRKVLTRHQYTRVFKLLKNGEVATYDDWKGRFQANSEKMRTGDIMAVVEVLKTTLTYCSDGRVRVTFIVDTVLVVMLTEIISRWFSGVEWQQFAMLGGILLTLGLIRVVAVRYSPTPGPAIQAANQMVLSFS